jgi:DNA-binding protein H-NS
MDVSVVNIENMTESDLRELIRQAQQSLDRRIAERARATLKEAKRMAAEVGFAATFTKIGKPIVMEKPFAPRGKAVQKYQNPDNPEETWAGRGRPPKWVQAALESGQSLEDLAIARESAAAGS